MKFVFAVFTLMTTSAWAYDAKDCADHVAEKKYPANYCLLPTKKSPSLETWFDGLRHLPGPIREIEQAALEDSACDVSHCGLSTFSDKNSIVLDEGNDSMGGGSRIRYFISIGQGKSVGVIYTVDVSQEFDMRTDTSIRKIGKVQKFED